MSNMTPVEQRIFDAIQRLTLELGRRPTYRQIGDQVGLRSKATVHKHICRMERKGVLQRNWGTPEALKLVA